MQFTQVYCGQTFFQLIPRWQEHWEKTSTSNNCNLAISSLTNKGEERGQRAGNKEHRGGRNTRDYRFGGHSLSCSLHPSLWSPPLLTKANIHLRSAKSNVTRPLLAQNYRTKVHFPFMSHTLSLGILMNITDWFTEKLKTLSAGIQIPTPCSLKIEWKTSEKLFSC